MTDPRRIVERVPPLEKPDRMTLHVSTAEFSRPTWVIVQGTGKERSPDLIPILIPRAGEAR